MFALHPQLERDTFFVADLRLSRVLLMNNHLFPWAILVPREPDMRDIIDLDVKDRHLLIDEIAHVSASLQRLFKPDKLNVAALGNQVPQLHVHVIARFKTDSAWPHPVWGKAAELYGEAETTLRALKDALAVNP